MGDTKIEWADKSWNPVTGCTKVSQGCKNCYAERMAIRMWGERKFSDIACHMDRLEDPLRWKRPQRIFVNSMSDLFHERVPFDFISLVFKTMERAHWHTFQVLTKREKRMEEYFRSFLKSHNWPLPNVWLGVSTENQDALDKRLPWLLMVPAAARFLSCEPLLGPINLKLNYSLEDENGQQQYWGDRLDWVIVGGESGPGARPMHPDWARGIRDQCLQAGVKFFFKQRGEWTWDYPQGLSLAHREMRNGDNYVTFYRVGKKLAGRMLDGREWNEYPEVCR